MLQSRVRELERRIITRRRPVRAAVYEHDGGASCKAQFSDAPIEEFVCTSIEDACAELHKKGFDSVIICYADGGLEIDEIQ